MKFIKSIGIDVSLQNELLSKAEENRQVSLCLEDAMRETNELKSQVSQSLFNETAWNHKDTKLKNRSTVCLLIHVSNVVGVKLMKIEWLLW